MKKLPIVLLLVGILLIGGCVESTTISKSTTNMSLNENDLPPEWNISTFRDYKYYTTVDLRNNLNKDIITSSVVRYNSSYEAEGSFKQQKLYYYEHIKSGANKINTENVFSKNTECFSYSQLYSEINKWSSNEYKRIYWIMCSIKNINFHIQLLTEESINEENKELLLNLAKTIENKIIS